jgi:hypothetical protein
MKEAAVVTPKTAGSGREVLARSWSVQEIAMGSFQAPAQRVVEGTDATSARRAFRAVLAFTTTGCSGCVMRLMQSRLNISSISVITTFSTSAVARQ